jgi:hypothetical protein
LIALQAASLAWVQTRTPKFGILIARKQFDDADRLFRVVSAWSVAALVTALIAFWGFVSLLYRFRPEWGERLLPPSAIAVFALGMLAFHVQQCLVIYVRAHKREPFLLQSVISSAAIGGLVWYLGKNYGPLEAGSAFLAVNAIYTVPSTFYLWHRCRVERS